MVTLRSGRSTDTSRVAIKPESAGMPHLSTECPHGTIPVARTPNRPPKFNSLRSKFGVGNFAALEPGTPLVLSPASTASTVTSPGDGNDIWDSPDRSRDRSDGALKSGDSSPMSPPTVYEVLDKETPVPKVSKVVQTSAFQNVSGEKAVVQLQTRAREKENEQLEQLQAEDDFIKPEKLIRNLTKMLQAIADTNAMAALGKYTMTPNFDFEHAGNSYHPPHSRRSPPKTTIVKISNDAALYSAEGCFKSEEVTSTTSGTRALRRHVVVLEQILPYSIHTRLSQNLDLCVASLIKRPEERCSVRRPPGSIDRIIKDISRCNVKAEHTTFIGYVEQLVCAVVCGRHRNVALHKKRQEELKDLLTGLSCPSTDDCSNIQAWIDAISDSNLPPGVPGLGDRVSDIAHEPAPSNSHKAMSRPAAQRTTRPTSIGVPVTLEHIPYFSSYQPKWTRFLSVSKALHKVITRPLKPTDQKFGFIYLFWDREHFGMLKIGRTNNLERRLEEWNQDCGRTHSYHPAIVRGELLEIPHVSRVERLIHLELKNRRKEKFCANCNKHHQEWFDVRDDLALKVFQKWQKWIVQKPYALNAQTGKWVLRPEMMDTLSQVCEPVSTESESLSPRRGRAGRQGRRKS